MLTTIPPWLQSGPEVFLGAAKSGAAAGQAAADALNNYDIHRQEIASHAATAAAQIGAEQQRAAAALALQKAHQEATHQLNLAHLALSGDRLSSLNDYREQVNELRKQGLDQREAAAALRDGFLHIGNKFVQKNPDGSFKVLFDAGEGNINPLDRMKYERYSKIAASAAAALSKGDLSPEDAAAWKTRGDQAQSVLQDIENRYQIKPQSTGKPGGWMPPDQGDSGIAPNGWVPTTDGSARRPYYPGVGASGSAADALTDPGISMPDGTAVDYGNPEQTNGIQVLSIRQKQ